MNQYKENVRLWWKGFTWLRTREAIPTGLVPGERIWVDSSLQRKDPERPTLATMDNSIVYQPNWGPRKFFLVYLFNYGTRVLTGGACVSWSKWFYFTKETNRFSHLVTRLLNLFDKKHGFEAGPILWGAKATKWVGVGAACFWIVAILLLAFGIAALLSSFR